MAPAPGLMHPTRGPNPPAAADPDSVWSALLELRSRAAAARLPAAEGFTCEPGNTLRAVAPDAPDAWFVAADGAGWRAGPALAGPARLLAELYLPTVVPPLGRCHVVGHLGQSLDGFIATRGGDSDFVTGPENLDHLHRMRALCHGVLVGAGTIEADDPELTTRRVEGPSPVRIVLDPALRLDPRYRVFNDGRAATWVVHAEGARTRALPAGVEQLAVPLHAGRLALEVLVERLHGLGFGTLFVEGGGVTVSSFLRAGLLDRLQIAVAPLVIGNGRRGVQLDGVESLAAALRLPCRVFAMGQDVLFDCAPVRSGGAGSAPPPVTQRGGSASKST